jgi:Siphovirus Gp157
MAAAQIVPTRQTHCTLYELEDNLQALVNSIDLAEAPSSRTAILDEIGQALRKTREKRDSVAAFLRHCTFEQQFADAEIERLAKRKAFIARVQEELERRVIEVIEQFVQPDRRGVKRLVGNCSSLRIQKNPDSVVVADPNLVPPALKAAVVTMPAYAWEALLQCLDLEERKQFEGLLQKLEYKPDKRAIGAELKNGTEIPGADLAFGDWRLVLG